MIVSVEGEVIFFPLMFEMTAGWHDRKFGWTVCLITWSSKKFKKWRKKDICL